jgi:hypothetical protein
MFAFEHTLEASQHSPRYHHASKEQRFNIIAQCFRTPQDSDATCRVKVSQENLPIVVGIQDSVKVSR